MDEKLKLAQAEQVKKFAFFGVAVSTVATLTAIIAVPMLCMYMQNVQSGLQDEINFCRTRAVSLRGEYVKVGTSLLDFLLGSGKSSVASARIRNESRGT